MASPTRSAVTMSADDDDANHTSLLEIIQERNRGKKGLIHRIVYIGRLKDDISDRSVIGEYHEQLLKNSQNHHQMEQVTGLLLLFPKHFIHIVESSMETLLDIVCDLVKQTDSDESNIVSAKILSVAHDIQARMSAQWNYRTLDIHVANIETYDATDSTDRLIVDMLTQTLKLGSYLTRQPKNPAAVGEEVSQKSAMDSLHEKVPELLPQQAVIEYLLSEQSSHMMVPDEFLCKYTQTFDSHLATEHTWPLPTQLFPYTY